MDDIWEQYEATIKEEDQIVLTLHTQEESAAALCHWVYKFGKELDITLIAELMDHIGQKQQQAYVRLLLIRLKKAELAYYLNQSKTCRMPFNDTFAAPT